MSHHGSPCWYELASKNPAKVQAFYQSVLGWTWVDASMPGMDYMLGTAGQGMVAGLYLADADMPEAWQIYIAVDDVDAVVAQALGLGAAVIQTPADIPGTGRFAVLLDPQGARLGLLQPLPMAEGPQNHAFDPATAGHGVWQDLVTSDAEAALKFYAALFGWTVSRSLPMGPAATYFILSHQGRDIGGTFASKAAPYWKPYFGVKSAKSAAARVVADGGQVLHGPDSVPGGQFTLQITDPRGVILGLAGPA